MEALRRRRTSTVQPSAKSSSSASASCSNVPEWEATLVVGDGALLAPAAASDAAATEPAHSSSSADAKLHAQAAPGDADAESNWEKKVDATDWEHPGMPVVMIPRDTPGEGHSSEQRFEGLAYPCDECGYHFDLHYKPKKRFWTWLKTRVRGMLHVEIFVFMLLPTCVAVSLIFGWLQGISIVKQTSWPLGLTLGLLMALHTGSWMRAGLETVRSIWKAYRDWEPYCDSWLIARLVDKLAGRQVEALARAKVTALAAETEGEPGDAGGPPCPETD